jgi:hypothetical protein
MLLWTSLYAIGAFGGGGGPGPTPGNPLVYHYGEPNAAGTCGATRDFRDELTVAQAYISPFDGDITGVQVYLNETLAPTIRVGVYADNGFWPARRAPGRGRCDGAGLDRLVQRAARYAGHRDQGRGRCLARGECIGRYR